jgi:hypothetical protein
VEFFDEAEKLGEVLAPPYVLVWSNSAPGLHVLTSVATDTNDNVITSLPTHISVIYPLMLTSLIPTGATWKYLDTGQGPAAGWKTSTFDDASWRAGSARLGYGGDGEVTVVNSGPTTAKYITTYFRHAFDLTNTAAASNLMVRLLRDDGATVYLNGVEIFRSNLPPGPLTSFTPAVAAVGGMDEQAFFATQVSGSAVVAGRNIIAVELHQVNATSSDLGFDLELIGAGPADGSIPALSWEWLGDHLKFSWLATAADWDLYVLSGISDSNTWTIAPGATSVMQGRKIKVVSLDSESRFFRLGLLP